MKGHVTRTIFGGETVFALSATPVHVGRFPLATENRAILSWRAASTSSATDLAPRPTPAASWYSTPA